jgi:hypothetical protein
MGVAATPQRLEQLVLRHLFIGARTHNAWQNHAVPDEKLMEIFYPMKI